MKRFGLLLSIAALLTGLPQTYAQCYKLIWSEEFSYSGLPSSDSWNIETGGFGGGNNELQYYRADTSNLLVKDSMLVITARKENYGGKLYTSGRIQTKGKFEFQYGKIEARMRLPYGQGIWPALWMLGQNIDQASWPACGEIDIMEMVGGAEGDNTVHGTNHWEHDGYHASFGRPYSLSSGIFADTFHVFTMEWSPSSTKWYVDGYHFNTMSITGTDLSEFHQPFFVLLNLAVGGNWPGSPDATTVFPQKFEIDYVRVYKDVGTLKIEGNNMAGEKQAGLLFSLPHSDSLSYQWSVPEDAEITEGQGSESIRVNWGCRDGDVTCDVSSSCGSHTASLDVKVESKLSGPMFAAENEEGLRFSIHEMTGTEYDWQVPGDATIISGQENDTLIVNWGKTFEDVVLTTSNTCGTSQLTHEVLRKGSYPYPDPHQAHVLPGTIEAVDYNYGGEGVAYHDLSGYNEGDGERQDENVDTQFSDNGSPNVGWILNGEWLEYSIKVDSSWLYNVSMRVATQNASGGPFSILVNGESRMTGISVPGTGEWDNFTTITPGTLRLNETDTILRVHFNNGGFNLGRMVFSLAASNDVGEYTPAAKVKVYPNPARDFLMLESPDGSSYRILDLGGRELSSGEVKNKPEQLDIRELQAGTYFIVINEAHKTPEVARFVKLK